MKPSFFTITLISIIILSVACTNHQNLSIPYSDPHIAYSGRIDTSSAKSADLYWSGTSIRINFKGDSVYGIFQEEKGDNYYNVILDGDSIFLFRPGIKKETHLLAANLSPEKHTLEIFKRTEWDSGKSSFFGFEIKGSAELLPAPEPKKRKIEFYGNSITAGYAVDDFSGQDRSDSVFTNNYLSYANILSKHFDADFRCICKSGIGITVSWFPLIMPEMYDRLIPNDPDSHWDFSLYTPDVVIINLFQNDCWLVNLPDHEQFKARFGEKSPTDEEIIHAYKEFVAGIKKEYPDTKIICALGNMDVTQEGSKWPGYIEKAVQQLNDSNIYTHFVPFKNSPGHPTIAEQEALASSLIDFIEKNIEW